MSVYLFIYIYIFIIWREICITHIISYQYYISGIIYHTSAYIHNICLYIYTHLKTKTNVDTHHTHITLYIYACFCLHTYLTPLQLNHIYLSQSEAGHKILQCLPIRSTELVPSSLDSEHMVNMVTSEYNVRLPTGIGLTRLTGFPLHRVN